MGNEPAPRAPPAQRAANATARAASSGNSQPGARMSSEASSAGTPSLTMNTATIAIAGFACANS